MRVAQGRREQELCRLVREGLPLMAIGKSGHWMVGSLHIYTASGRWFNEKTGRRGRLRNRGMAQIVESECFKQLSPGDPLQLTRIRLNMSRAQQLAIGLLFGHLDLAFTFLETALTTRQPEARRRNQANALKACDIVSSRALRMQIPPDTRQLLTQKLLALKERLLVNGAPILQ